MPNDPRTIGTDKRAGARRVRHAAFRCVLPVPSRRACACPLFREVQRAREGDDVAMASDMDAWDARAACRTVDPDALFVEGAAQNGAKVLCVGCRVRSVWPMRSTTGSSTASGAV